jgi:hypothetical protein
MVSLNRIVYMCISREIGLVKKLLTKVDRATLEAKLIDQILEFIERLYGRSSDSRSKSIEQPYYPVLHNVRVSYKWRFFYLRFLNPHRVLGSRRS